MSNSIAHIAIQNSEGYRLSYSGVMHKSNGNGLPYLALKLFIAFLEMSLIDFQFSTKIGGLIQSMH